MRIAITGASSFIGRALLRRLIDAGHTCTAVVRNDALLGKALSGNCKTVRLDMSEYGAMRKAVGDVDCLINLAWLGTRGSDRMDAEMQKKSFEYTLDAVKSFGDSPCRIVMTAGSQAEYGNIEGAIKESDTPAPNTEYGKYKLELFERTSEYCGHNGIRLIEPRFFSLYGPNDYERTMIVSMMKKMLRNEPCELTKSIQMWDFLYLDDAVDGMCQLIANGSASGAYNFASGDSRQLKEYVEEMKTVLHSQSELLYGAVPYPPTGMVSIMADISKLEGTGWSAKTPFAVGIGLVKDALEKQVSR